MNEWELAAAYAKGDEQAFATLLRTFFPLVYSAAVRQVGELQLAEEITQSVFILFARKAAGLSRSVSLPGWLLRTTRFVAKDALKQMNRRRKREQAAAAAQASAAEGWAPPWREAAPLVDEALLALPAPEQTCVVARFIEGRSFREIGASLGLSEDAAQKRVARGLEKIRLFLRRRGVTSSTAVVTGLLGINLTSAADAQVLQAT